MCSHTTVYICPYTTIYVSSYRYLSSYYYICVLQKSADSTPSAASAAGAAAGALEVDKASPFLSKKKEKSVLLLAGDA
jgi:hypothetical protein